MIYARALGSRHPGTHNLHIIEEADHNFTGVRDIVLEYLAEFYYSFWFAATRRGSRCDFRMVGFTRAERVEYRNMDGGVKR
jgi:hypothetical protein